MVEPLVVVGAGGFGRETLDVAEAMNTDSDVWDILGVVDDNPSEVNLQRLSDRGIAFLGSISERPSHASIAIAIGSPSARKRVALALGDGESRFATLIHPTAVLGSRFVMGEGAVICAGVSVGTNVAIGDHVHLNPHAVIGHDSILADHVSINPNATVSGECVIGAGVLIGAVALVLQGRSVGAESIVGGAACVTNDVRSGQVVKGVPAR